MSRLDREPRRHIHDSLVHECNEMSIRIKLHYIAEENEQIKKAKQFRTAPTWEEIESLIWKCVTEMNQCTDSYKRS